MNTLENNNSLSLVKKLVITGALSALVIVLTVTHLGMITIGPISATILHIPVIIAVCLAGLPYGLFVAFAFGLSSLILATTTTGAFDKLFINPLISIAPRLLFALAAWAIWKLLMMIPKMPKFIAAAVSGFISTIAHTFFVISSIYIVGGSGNPALGGTGYFAFLGIVTPNAIGESVASTIVCFAVFASLFAVEKSKSKFSKIEE